MEIVPIAGATLGSKLASHWQGACNLSDELAANITPALSRGIEGGDAVIFKVREG